MEHQELWARGVGVEEVDEEWVRGGWGRQGVEVKEKEDEE